MAMDTASRRASAIMHSLPFRGLLPIPDGTVGQEDRQQVAFMYAGISAAESGEPPPDTDREFTGSMLMRWLASR